ncbi:MAG: DedA family protein [candidate division Zixibacteria bacterium CG_4_9_14_3_um_filter_46_8]|nr:MAG: DedA family protein [candidate division Zixibacteria bacterium CG_4_9_14_3_um_filter_46_8]
MGLTEFLVDFITELISAVGYAGVALLMALESMIAPVPSEAVMPFAGFLIYEGKFTFAGVIFFSTVGSIIGSLISYYAGARGGRPFVHRFGKYLLLDQHHLEMTVKFFGKYGDKTIFISRFIPVVRHLISIPAGVGRMNLLKFTIYTIIGAGLWNAFLTYVGYHLKDNWSEVRKYSEVVDVAVMLTIAGGIIYIIYHYRKRMSRSAGKP